MRISKVIRNCAAAASALMLVAGCASAPTTSAPTTGLTSAPTAAATAATTAVTASASNVVSPTPTRNKTSEPTATGALQPTELTPSLEIDLAPATGLIPIASDGKMVWAVGDHTLLRIDAETNTVERLDAPVESDDTTLSLADDGLWATRWAGGRLYRLDPQTGETILDVVMPKAVRVAFIGDEMWVGREDQDSMSVVDRETGDVGSASVEAGAYGFAGMGDLWFTPGLESQVVRVDPATGNIKATIPVTGESNCQIGGTFPDNAWTSCFGREVIERSVTRVDPTTNEAAVVATLPPTHGGSVVAINGQPWFIGSFEDAAGDLFAGLLRINSETGAIEQFFSIPGADPDPSVVAGDALWVPDEARHKLLRIELSDLDAG